MELVREDLGTAQGESTGGGETSYGSREIKDPVPREEAVVHHLLGPMADSLRCPVADLT
jgi:hypothetical protein